MTTPSSNAQLIETMSKLSSLMKGSMKFYSDFQELTFLQMQALIFIKKAKNIQMSEIATHFQIEMPTATSLINKLNTMKLVKRQADPKDRRLVRIILTEQGKQLLEKALEERTKKINHLLSYLSKNDTLELLRILQILIKHMEENDEK